LLEALDPEQNFNFSDHYLEVPFDLSEVFFVTTANIVENIPPALRDRLEIIEFNSYSTIEKMHIAKDYIWPKVVKNAGIDVLNVTISDEALFSLIDSYTDEAGVRELERQLSKITRKIALEYTQYNKLIKRIEQRDLVNYLGQPTVYKWEKEQTDQVGVIAGLAVTNNGGQVLSIEALVIPEGRGYLTLTGHLGDVMKESAQAALSHVKSISTKYHLDSDLIRNSDFHVHVPLGSIPKDGPSAGAGIAIAIFSALSGKKISKDLGITGEVSLSGRVLKIGGLQEKVLAAKRAGLKKIIIPLQNKTDYDQLDKIVKNGLEVKFVNNIEEAINNAIMMH
jgi:ATP-dependent Lon protease